MKIDQNEFCICESSKKFKNCCLPKMSNYGDQTTFFFFNYHIPVFSRMFSELGPNIDSLRQELTKSHAQTFFSLLAPPSSFPYFASIQIVDKWKRSLETLMETIISRHHVFYWFHLYRRFAPENVFDYKSNVSTWLVRMILETAFLKYGIENKAKLDEEILQGDDIDINQIMSGESVKAIEPMANKMLGERCFGVYIKKFNISLFLELLSIEYLASEYHAATVMFRRANKGGELKVISPEYYYIENDDGTEHLIKSFDSRCELYGGDVSSKGLSLQKGQIEEGSKGFLMLPSYNVNRLTFGDYPFHEIWRFSFKNIESFSPNFIWIPFDLDKFYRINLFLKDGFLAHYGFSLDSFLNCIIGLYLYISLSLRREPIKYGDMFVQRAYQLFESKEYLAENVSKLLNDESSFIGEHVPSVSEISKVFDAFTLTDIKRHQIDLTTMGPRYFILRTFSESIMVDYAALLSVLSTAMHFIKSNESKKGKVFEDYVEGELTNQDFIKWKHGQLRSYDDSVIEIDSSFINRNIMFLCELKCINRSFAFERGDAEAIRFRINKFTEALDECEKKAEWLSLRREGNNYRIPDNVVAIIPIVVSPFVEYVWSGKDYFWLTEEIPRICTPSELLELNSPDIIKKIIKKSFVRYIH